MGEEEELVVGEDEEVEEEGEEEVGRLRSRRYHGGIDCLHHRLLIMLHEIPKVNTKNCKWKFLK